MPEKYATETSETRIDCYRCGTCCIAPDISTLHKPIGVPCPHLREDHLCGIYADRPPVCREYRPDEICRVLHTLPEDKRVAYYLQVYDLLPAAESVTPHPVMDEE